MGKDTSKEIPITFAGSEQETEGIELSERESEGGAEQEQTRPEPEVSPDAESSEQESDGDGSIETIGQARKQIESLTQERATLYDQLLRRQAEFDNFRKRVERERTDFYQRARADLLLELLPVVDNLERALASAQTEAGFESLHKGVELIHKQLKDALAKLGLQEIEAVGQSFDPHLHEAITMEETDEHQENTVIQEFQRGYKLGDRLLRPAKVKVATSPER